MSRVSLAVGKGKDGEASCGISINGMYYVQSVTLDHPDFFTGTVEIQVGKDAQWTEETWGSITPVESSNIIGRVQFKNGTFTGDVSITVSPMTAAQSEAAQKQNQRQVVPQGKYTVAQISEAIQGIMTQKRSALGLSETDNLLSGDELIYAGSSATDWLPIGLSRCGVEDDYDAYLAALQTYVEQKYREPDKLDRVKATEWHRISLAVLACGGDPTHFGKDESGNDINLIADGVYDRGKTVDIGAQGLNGWLWGLITLDSMKYNIPAGSSYTRTEMIKRILSFPAPGRRIQPALCTGQHRRSGHHGHGDTGPCAVLPKFDLQREGPGGQGTGLFVRIAAGHRRLPQLGHTELRVRIADHRVAVLHRR